MYTTKLAYTLQLVYQSVVRIAMPCLKIKIRRRVARCIPNPCFDNFLLIYTHEYLCMVIGALQLKGLVTHMQSFKR